MFSRLQRALPLALLLSLWVSVAQAQEITTGELAYAIDNVVLFIAAVLVLFMQAGFAMVEAGFNSAKNTVNIMFKNIIDLGAGVFFFWLIGFGLMYGDSVLGGWLAFGGFGISQVPPEAAAGNLNPQVDFLFQVAFAATAATIVSGAVAGRMKVSGYLIYSIVITAFIYPISGYWKWGGGWLDAKGFYDFAGSSVVHAFGGFAALACVLILGPRKGKYTKDGIKPILGHSMPLAAIGVFLLWLGWFGFNGGSALSADPKAVSYALTTTSLAAAAGAVASIMISMLVLKKPDLSMALNGILAGLVGITAGADTVGEGSAIIIGLVAGVIVVFSILFFDKIKIDDPVGAISVHGVCGMWGTVAVGLFSFDPEHSLGVQILGTLSISVFAFIFAFVVFFILKMLGGVRVSEEEESEGLDVAEHGAPAYNLH